MRIPRFLVTVPYLHSYDLSDIFYHNDMGMVKLTRIRFQILCVFDLKVAGKKFVYSFSPCAKNGMSVILQILLERYAYSEIGGTLILI